MADPIYYIDISKTGKDYTGNRDISLLVNEQALLESVKNILITEPGDRVMNPTFGCPLNQYVFEPIDPILMVSIRNTITNSIRSYEDRVDNLKININMSIDMNTIEIIVLFNMKTKNNTLTLTLSLNKIR